jgi:hypothetical protein
MAKSKTYSAGRAPQAIKSRSAKSGTWVKRDSKSGQFVIGRAAFGKVSEVEGIVVSRNLKADLRRLESSPHEKRRSVLAQKYGKK